MQGGTPIAGFLVSPSRSPGANKLNLTDRHRDDLHYRWLVLQTDFWPLNFVHGLLRQLG